MRPGTTYREVQSVKRSGPPTGTDPWFLTGITTKGVPWDANQTVITSWDQFLDRTGGRITTGIAYDAVEAYFRLGGQRLYFSRVLGPSALRSSKILLDASSGQSLKVWATSPGVWGDSLRIAVLAGDIGTNFKLVLTHTTDTTINYISPDLPTTDDAVTWAANTSGVKKYITIDKLGANDPAAAAASALTGGTDDIGNVTDAIWKAAGLAFPKDLPSGQFSMAGRTTSQAYADSLEIAYLTDRKAILDLPDTTDPAVLKSTALALRSNPYWKNGATFAGWGVAPGVTLGTTRVVPPSACVAAKIAHNEVIGNEDGPLTANDPAAGDNGTLDWLLDVKPITGFTDAVQTDLNASGVNVIYRRYGQIKIYGWRSLGDPNDLYGSKWLNFANVRLEMAIRRSALIIAEKYVEKMIDGRKHKLASFQGDLVGMLKDDYLAHDAIFYNDDGTPGMWVDVLSPEINPTAQLEQMTLKGKIGVKMSPMAEEVIVEFTKIGLTEVVA